MLCYVVMYSVRLNRLKMIYTSHILVFIDHFRMSLAQHVHPLCVLFQRSYRSKSIE